MANNYAFTNQRGYGYLDINVSGLMDMVSDAGNVYEDNTNKSNIEIVKKGNYTIKLTTELSNTTLDTITLIRNSDPLVDLIYDGRRRFDGRLFRMGRFVS